MESASDIARVNVVSHNQDKSEYKIEISSKMFMDMQFDISAIDLNILSKYIPDEFTGIKVDKIDCNTDVSSITLNRWYTIYFC